MCDENKEPVVELKEKLVTKQTILAVSSCEAPNFNERANELIAQGWQPGAFQVIPMRLGPTLIQQFVRYD